MSDDRCSPTGKRASVPTQGVAVPSVCGGASAVLRILEGDIRMVDAYELALDASMPLILSRMVPMMSSCGDHRQPG